jgi:peptidoglycan biosynthesis protein MviN/MurJ (putative lipid II flippase)
MLTTLVGIACARLVAPPPSFGQTGLLGLGWAVAVCVPVWCVCWIVVRRILRDGEEAWRILLALILINAVAVILVWPFL